MLPERLCLPREDILEGHFLPKQPLLLNVEVAGSKVLQVCQRPARESGVNAGRDREGGAWNSLEMSDAIFGPEMFLPDVFSDV